MKVRLFGGLGLGILKIEYTNFYTYSLILLCFRIRLGKKYKNC